MVKRLSFANSGTHNKQHHNMETMKGQRLEKRDVQRKLCNPQMTIIIKWRISKMKTRADTLIIFNDSWPL